jgi:hypothetical protein
MTWGRFITHHSFTMLPIGRNLGDITPKSANLFVVVGEFSKTDVKSCELLERYVPKADAAFLLHSLRNSTIHIITVVSSNSLSFFS